MRSRHVRRQRVMSEGSAMRTYYIRFCKVHVDPVWGSEPLPWIRTPLIRVTRNRRNQAVFEWVGAPGVAFDLKAIKAMYPAVVREAGQ